MVNWSDEIVKSKEVGSKINGDAAHGVSMRDETREEEEGSQQRRAAVEEGVQTLVGFANRKLRNW
jgi:hypothetical protein